MRNIHDGFTLIETLVATAVLTVFFLSAALIIQTGLQSIGQAKLRSEATRIAQERLEMVRNLPYDDVGTLGGIPAGQLTAHETIQGEGITYTVDTSVLYIDDPFDGTAPTDLLPVDYKRVKVAVTWNGLFSSKQPLILLTDVSPKGIELADDAGTLSILVFNSQGMPVNGAAVHIEASLSPAINMDVTTDDSGMVLIPGAPMCTSCYKISVTKSGYTSDRTHGTDEVANPVKPHVSVLEGLISSVSFAIDAPSTVSLRVTRNQAAGYSPFVGAQLILRGTKEIGRTTDDDPVYKVDQTMTTSTGGLVTVGNLEWDNYSLLLPTGSSVDFAGSWPFMPLLILPGVTTNVSAVVTANTVNSLLIQMTNELHQPVTAQVELNRMGVIATQSAGIEPNGDTSQVFFNGLTAGSYGVVINAPGYATTSGTVSVSGDQIEQYTIATTSATP